MIDLSRAAAIEGWMQPSELQWLAQEAAKRERIVEIGSYLGRSTRAMGDATTGRVLAVDTWAGPEDASIAYADRRTIRERFQANLRDLIDARRVRPVDLDHALLPDRLEMDEPPDMIFIDGDHRYESVVRDVSWGLSQIRRGGGLLCGHDIDRMSVQQAVRDVIGPYRLAGGLNSSIWFQTYHMRAGAPARGTRGF